MILSSVHSDQLFLGTKTKQWRTKMNIMEIDETHLNEFPAPAPYLSTNGVTREARRYTPFSEIIVESSENEVKKNGVDSKNVNELREWMGRKVDFSAPIPVIEAISPEQDADGVVKRYRLIDGYNRMEAMRLLGLTHYFFDVINFRKAKSYLKAKIDVKFKLNERPPAYTTTNADYALGLSKLVESGDVEKTEEAMFDYLQSITSLNNQAIQVIIDKVCNEVGVERSFKNWTPAYIKADAPKLGIQVSGKWDPKRKAVGYTAKQNSGYKTLYQILGKLLEGKESYVVAHVTDANNEKTLKEKRAETKAEWDDIANRLHAFGKYYQKTRGQLSHKFIGFLPQNNQAEMEIVKK